MPEHTTKHLKLLGKTMSPVLNDPEVIRSILLKLVHAASMEVLGEPSIYVVPLQKEKLQSKTFQDEGGVTGQIVGYVTLTTSHAAIHTWPLREEFHLDVYSCKAYDQDAVLRVIAHELPPYKVKITDCSNGCDWD